MKHTPGAMADRRVETGDRDVVVVGAGFAGLYALHKFSGMGLSTIGFEAAGDVGGTWYWNRYPGARCDVQSQDYSFSFSESIQQEWAWSEIFAAQPEILAYANFVAEKLDLRRAFCFETRVTRVTFNDDTGCWFVETDRGDRINATYCVMATGCLSQPKLPDITGMDDFAGETYFTSRWPHETVNFAGKRVGVIGTGSSGIQAIPLIAEEAEHLYVFQRTPSFTLPARNRSMTAEQTAAIKRVYPELRARARQTPNCGLRPITDRKAFSVDQPTRDAIYEDVWRDGGITLGSTFADLVTDEDANRTASDFFRNKIGQVVVDPVVAERLKPYDYPIGTRRICLDTDYYETFNRANVSLVDVQTDPIDRIDAKGLSTGGRHYELDILVFATGFDAMTGALLAMDITGKAGRRLKEKWVDGPAAYLGIATAGFPNMFLITGPGSPSVLSNVIGSIEQHVEWVADCINHMRAIGADHIDPREDAEIDWVAHVNEVADSTLLPKANSWYIGANIPGKPRIFMPYAGGCHNYRKICDEVAADGYRGFVLEMRDGSLEQSDVREDHGVSSSEARAIDASPR